MKWISVEDRLPTDVETVMVSRGKHGYWWGKYDILTKEWIVKHGNGFVEVPDITHWMPLPEKPK